MILTPGLNQWLKVESYLHSGFEPWQPEPDFRTASGGWRGRWSRCRSAGRRCAPTRTATRRRCSPQASSSARGKAAGQANATCHSCGRWSTPRPSPCKPSPSWVAEDREDQLVRPPRRRESPDDPSRHREALSLRIYLYLYFHSVSLDYCLK